MENQEKTIQNDNRFDLRLVTEQEVAAMVAEQKTKQSEEQAVQVQKQEEAADRKQKAKGERQAKFDQARRTGKRVLLEQHFLAGNDIPRNYHDEESDFGHACIWAEPDGTTSESFSHAY